MDEEGRRCISEGSSVREARIQLPLPLSALPALSGAMVANRHVQPLARKMADTAGAAER